MYILSNIISSISNKHFVLMLSICHQPYALRHIDPNASYSQLIQLIVCFYPQGFATNTNLDAS